MATIFGALSIVSLLTLCVQYFFLWRKVGRQVGPPLDPLPISVLKPLKDVDEGLYENLSAIVRQDYPRYEVIFGAEDPLDPALDVARLVQRENPSVAIQIVSGARLHGLNPKVRTLSGILERVSYDWILVSDSNVRPDSGYLAAMRATAEESDGRLVHNLLVGVGEQSLGARFENLHMNGWVAGAIAVCDAGRHPIVVGKSMLMRRSDLESVGGLERVADVLAEDYVLGEVYRQRGWPVVLSPYRLRVVSGARDFSTFLNRHVRWGQLRRHIAPQYFLAELIANPTPFLLGWAVAASDHPGAPFGLPSAVLPLSLLLVKWTIEVATVRLVCRETGALTLALMPIKDVLVPFMWVLSAVRTRVTWRGHQMRIGPGSRLLPIEEKLVTEASRA